jgi:hypothetical protein
LWDGFEERAAQGVSQSNIDHSTDEGDAANRRLGIDGFHNCLGWGHGEDRMENEVTVEALSGDDDGVRGAEPPSSIGGRGYGDKVGQNPARED